MAKEQTVVLDTQGAINLINQLKSSRITIDRETAKKSLLVFISNNPNLKKFLPFSGLPTAYALDNPKVLTTIQNAFVNWQKSLVEQQKIDKFKAVVIRPEILIELENALEKQKQELEAARQKQTPVLTNIKDLRNHVLLVNHFQFMVESAVDGQLDNYWSPQERSRILAQSSQHITRSIIRTLEMEQRVRGKPLTDSETLALLNTSFFSAVIVDLRRDPYLAAALNTKKLAPELAHLPKALTAPELNQLTTAQKNIDSTNIALAPKREELVRLMQNKGLSERELAKLETILPAHPRLTKYEVQQAIQSSIGFNKTLALKAQGITVEAVSRDPDLCLHVQNYFAKLSSSQPKPAAYRVSKKAQRWGQKLKLNLTTTEGSEKLSAIHYLLLGQTPKFLQKEIKRLQSLGFNVDAGSLLSVFNTMVDPLFTQQLPPRLQRQIRRAQSRLQRQIRREQRRQKFFSAFDKINPFSIVRKLSARFSQWRWNKWGKLINRLPFSAGFKNFLYKLPARYFTYWIRPGYWLRWGTSKAMMWFGKQLGQRALGVALRSGSNILLKEGFKKLFSKVLTTGLMAILGLGTGGIATVLSILSFVKNLLFSKSGREMFKQLIHIGVKILSAAGIFLAFLIAGAPFTFFGIIIGGLIGGPWGAVLGGAIGGAIDWAIHTAGGIGKAISGIGSAATTAANVISSTTTIAAAGVGIPVAIGVAGAIGIPTAAYLYEQNVINSAMISPPEMEAAASAQTLKIIKTADKTSGVKAGDEITYTITITSGKPLEIISVVDNIAADYLENISISASEPLGVYDDVGKTINWSGFTLSGPGSTQIFNYKAKVKSTADATTKITNIVTAAAVYNGQAIIKQASLTLNSDGSEIAGRAMAIVNNLNRGFWNFYNNSPDYPELFDNNEYNCCNSEPNYLPNHNHCYRSNTNPSGCSGDPAAINKTNALFWCTWLVIKSYSETGHSIPAYLGVSQMQNWFNGQGRFLPANTNVSNLTDGDVIFFKKSGSWAHVGIICGLNNRNDYVTVCEANNWLTIINYTVSNGTVQGQGSLTVAGFGTP